MAGFDFLTSKSSLRFPVDKVEDYDDYMQFTVYKYQPPFRKAKCIGESGGSIYGSRYADYDTTGFGGGELEQSEFKKVILYMPEDIRDAHTRGWGEKGVGNIERAGLRAAGQAIDTMPNLLSNLDSANAKAAIQGMAPRDAAQQGKALAKALGIRAAAGATGVDANIITGGLLGQVINPNLEVLFDGIGLRSFDFNWTLVPRNSRESKVIKEIIWQFKKASAPSMEADGWFMKVPYVFKIQYKQGSKDNHWLNKIKACALQSIGVSYTAAGSYSTMEDGSPTAVNLSLSFKELKQVISEDFGDSFDYTKQYY